MTKRGVMDDQSKILAIEQYSWRELTAATLPGLGSAVNNHCSELKVFFTLCISMSVFRIQQTVCIQKNIQSKKKYY